MGRAKYFLYILAAVSLCVMSCEEEDDSSDKVSVNKWIMNTMKSDYLWNSEVKAKIPDYSLSPEAFFYSLLSNKDGKDRGDSHSYYSYIEKNKNYQTKTINSESTYGFEFIVFNLVNQANVQLDYNYAKVLYVLPGSPAEQAGLKRGDLLIGVNGGELNSGNWNDLMSGNGVELTIYGRREPLSISASVPMNENPIFKDTVLEAGGKRIGYLVYNHFTTGPENDGVETVYATDMKEVFAKFRNANLDEFVLDLRYNGGGYLSCAQLLSGLLVPPAGRDELFCYLEDNKGQRTGYKFTLDGESLGLSRLFVLVSRSTASASEAVINGLKPYMKVILIGEQTEGKNVASTHYEENKYEWALQPIVSKISNKNNFSDYSSGFTPDYPLTEFGTLTTVFYPLGDSRELFLGKALNLISGGERASIQSTRSDVRNNVMFNSLSRKQTNAVLIK